MKKKKAHVLALTCNKGGVGKTTTAASVGGYLASTGAGRVLLVDLDPQMNLTTTFTDGVFDRTILDAFQDFKRRMKTDLPVYNIRENLDIVPSQVDIFSVEKDFNSFMLRDEMLRRLLEPLKGEYDWILIDCPTLIGTITNNALLAADSVIIPLSCDAYSIDGLNQIMGIVELAQEINIDLRVLGIVITKYRARRVTDQVIGDELAKHYGKLLFNTRIRENAAIARAPLVKKDIFAYDPASVGAIDYSAFSEEVIKSLKEGKH